MENILSEYDKSPGIISPDFEKMDLHLPKKAVFAFLGEKRIERFAFARGGEKVGTFVSLTKDFSLWMIKADKEELCVLQAPAGASAAVLLLERLYAYGVEKVVALGCCGALEKLAENVFFVVRKALRDEGTSYHYLPSARFVTLDESAADIVEGVLRENHVPCESCVTWSTDGFFRETKEKVKARRAEGCRVVDMECAALAACAAYRGKVFAQILFTADTLHDLSHEQRAWGKESRDKALLMGVKAAERL